MQICIVDNMFIRSSVCEGAKADLWFVHGFPESGLSFQEVFSSSLIDQFNIFVPDLPGFGVSPRLNGRLTYGDIADGVVSLIDKVSGNRPVGLVAHSWGSLVANEIIEILAKRLIGYVNIEGALVPKHRFFREWLEDTKISCEEFYDKYCATQFAHAQESAAKARYFASIRFANPATLMACARSGLALEENAAAGLRYVGFPGQKLFIWGEDNLSDENREFLAQHKLDHVSVPRAGHWPMIDDPVRCYTEIFNFFRSE